MNDLSVVSRRWLPNGFEAISQWRASILADVAAAPRRAEWHPVIVEFAELIDEDPVVRMYITQMIEQVPDQYRTHHPRSVRELLDQLNAVLTVAPAYVPPGEGEATALVGTPFSAILIWTMGTLAGFAAYRNRKINKMFKKLLRVWQEFLDGPDSRYVINNGPRGWQSEQAQAQLHMEDYRFDPDAPYWGFHSWNDFFTREVKEGARPIAGAGDDKIVVAACDSTVFRVARGVEEQAPFWIKAQPYSLRDMLDGHYVDEFVGGDVWQAFLSPFNYHRWHSPVSGTIRKAFVKQGLYFSQATSEGQDPTDQDHSEGYIAHVQTRALIFIDADDPAIGLMCVMPIGMVEISSCILGDGITEGARVEKGQELGYFAFGGSTHCLVFRPGAIKEFTALLNDEVQFGQTVAIAN